MTDTRELGRKASDQILETIRQGQDATVEAVKTWAETVQRFTPNLPIPAPVTDVAERFRKPADLVEDAFDFAEKALASQREFANKVFAAAAPADKAPAAPAKK